MMRLASSFTVAALVLAACGGRSGPDASPGGGISETGDDNAETRDDSGHGAMAGTGGSLQSGGAGGDAHLDGASGAAGSAGTNDEADAAGDAALACSNGVGVSGECTHPSCAGLAQTCGAEGNRDCCASPLVTGTTTATFYRSYDGVTFVSKAFPAKVSDFRLDAYEITVGRFRRFVAAYSPTMIAKGAGANPNNPSDTGWTTAWTANLAVDANTLIAGLKCGAPQQTWTDSAGSAGAESRPINCLDWYEAEAFCIWDGGRLPTESEWNYAASGGTEQRVNPWGSEAPDCSYANYSGRANGADYCVAPGIGATNAVGSESPKGDGRFGQSNLAGNVWEWTQDWYARPYTNPCKDCADLTAGTGRVIRGGSVFDGEALQTASFRGNDAPSDHDISVGARCARAP